MIFENGDHILFAGDSVTDMGSEQPVGENVSEGLGRSYVRMIDSFLAAYYPEVVLRISNAGISGHTSRDLLERFDRDVLSHHPDWVSICIGINDVWHQFDCPAQTERMTQPDEYEQNMEKMILALQGKVKGIFILAPYYIEPNRKDMLRARMDEYTAIARELAEKYGCIFVDFQDMYARYASIRHSSFICWDRVHPNQVGAMLMAREFLKHCDFDFSHDALKDITLE